MKSDERKRQEQQQRKKNPAAVALGKLGGRAPKSKPWGLSRVSKRRRMEVSAMGVAARRAKRKSTGTGSGSEAA